MHILIIPSWYQTTDNPTLGSFFREQAIALKKQGHVVSLAYTDIFTKRKSCYRDIKYLNDNGVNVYRMAKYKIPKSGFKIYNYVFYKGLKKLYKRIIEDIGPIDIIHCHSSILSGYSAMKISEKYDIPYIITEHYTGFARGLISNNKQSVIKKVFGKSDAIIAVSNSLKNDIKDYCKHKEILVIPNMIDISRFSTNVKRDSDEFTFLSVCYLTHKKGIDILLKAFSIAFKDIGNVKLEIGGDGEESNNLKVLSKNLGLDNKVNFLGKLTRDEVIEVMQNCDAFVLPSRFETFGVVFIEALACGKPVIGTRGQGPDDIVNEFNGILVEKENIDDLVEAMKSIYNNHFKYEVSRIMNDCGARFSEENVSKKIIEVYERILKS